MDRWLQTVSTHAGSTPRPGVDGLDAWIAGLETDGCFVSCSSGTTGKPAMLPSSVADLDFVTRANVAMFSWTTGIRPTRDRKFFGLGPRMNITRNERIRQVMIDAYCSPALEPYQLPIPSISIGATMEMILLRRRITEGTASPAEVVDFERLSGERQANIDAARQDALAALVEAREHKLLLASFFPGLHPLADALREQGVGGFHPDNAVLTGGGLKALSVPPSTTPMLPHGPFGAISRPSSTAARATSSRQKPSSVASPVGRFVVLVRARWA
ncbi:hypothetical protein BBK14_31700 [Parafrankia soli]|uniref:Uncharacterized protein n=1 Tax=Parafrankia soli TaxID=2599596 RepID=A0A1S1R9X8_9ACTN|nr:hypothetical protein [Parafrankia soli]OHV42796.1 hypothetical protein BBK14_31700 [Parafrankia soli]